MRGRANVHAIVAANQAAAVPRTGVDNDDAASNTSSDYDQPHGLREHLEHRYRKVNKWIDRNRKLFDFVAYFFFLLVFTLVASEANPGENLIEQNRAIKTAVAEQEFWKNASHVRKDLYDVDAVADFWNWLTPFANVVLGSNTAGGMFPDQPGFFYRYFRILGLMRLRQVRVGKNSCKVPEKLEEYIKDCYAPFTKETMDSSPFGPINENSGLAEWKWYSAKEMNEGSYTGRSWTVYPGSGYNVTIPLNYSAALERLYYLKDNNWIDLQTRAVFIDFIVYNANVKLITLIKVAVEFPASSGCRPHLLLRTSQIDRLVSSEMSNTALLAEIILLVLVSLYILHEIQNFRRLRWKYFDDTWVYLEIINYMLFIGAFILRFQPFYAVYRDGFPPRPDEFINFETPMFAIIQWKNVMSLNCVISWLRLFKYLREVPFMQLLIGTVSLAMQQMVSFLSIFVIIICGFTLANLLAFGGELAAFRTYEMTLYTLYRSLLGADYFDDMYEVNRFLGPLLYMSWTLIGFFLLLNMFVAILNDAIDEVKNSIPKISLSDSVRQIYAHIRAKVQKRYDSFVQDPDDEMPADQGQVDRIHAFAHNEDKKRFAEDPMAVLKSEQARKLVDPLQNDLGDVGGRPDTSQLEARGKSLMECETDEEKLATLESRLSGLLKGMQKLHGKEPLGQVRPDLSHFANPYGHNSLAGGFY